MNVCSLFHNYLPLENGVDFIRRNLNPFYPRMICAKFGWFRKRRCICKKFKDRRTTGDQKSSPGELKSKYPFYYTPDTLRNKISFLKLHGDTNMQLVTWCKSVIVDKINVTCWTCCWFSAEGSICSGDRHTIKDITILFCSISKTLDLINPCVCPLNCPMLLRIDQMTMEIEHSV